jgi:Mrp family chromosome partitioning ATPase
MDAAFIKAYGLSDAATLAQRERPRALQPATAEPMLPSAQPHALQNVLSDTAPAGRTLVEGSSLATYPSQTAVVDPANPRSEYSLDLRIDNSHGTKRPLSSFRFATDRLLDDVNAAADTATTTTNATSTALPPLASTLSDWQTPAQVNIQPAFFVPCFDWPADCRQLLALRRPMWDELVEQLQRGAQDDRRVLAIAPASRGAGATTLSLTLALALAEHGVRAALVDGDWDDPQLSTRLGLAPQVGWDDSDETQTDPSGLLIESAADGLVLLPCRQPLVAALVDLPYHAARMVRTLRATYDLVLVDTGPIDSPSVSWRRVWHRSLVDGVILVERAANTTDQNADAASTAESPADQVLASAGIAWWGVAETFANN